MQISYSSNFSGNSGQPSGSCEEYRIFGTHQTGVRDAFRRLIKRPKLRQQFKQAILSMVRAEERLRTTELQTEKCGDFSNIAGSYINEVMARKDDLIRFSNGIYH